MKIYLSVDIEGISNVVMTYQLFPGGSGGSIPEIREITTRAWASRTASWTTRGHRKP